MLLHIVGAGLLVPGFLGIRWFYLIYRGDFEASNVLETITAIFLVSLGFIGLTILTT